MFATFSPSSTRSPKSRCSDALAWLLGLSSICAALWTTSAAASARPPSEADELGSVTSDLAGEAHAGSSLINPAQLSSASRLDVALRGRWMVRDGLLDPGLLQLGGGALHIASAWPFGVALGLDFQHVRWQSHSRLDGSRVPLGSSKFGLSVALGQGHRASVGLGVHGVRRSGLEPSAPELTLGTLFRFNRFASTAATLRLAPIDQATLESDLWGTIPARLQIAGALAVRPLGRRWLELGGYLAADFDADRVNDEGRRTAILMPRVRMALRWQGLSLLAQLGLERSELSHPGRLPRSPPTQLAASIALSVAWDRFRGRLATFMPMRPQARLRLDLDAQLEFSLVPRGQPPRPRPMAIDKYAMSKLSGERGLLVALARLRRAERSGTRAIVLVDTRDVGMAWGDLQEFRAALQRVQQAGGRVFAWIESTAMKGFYLASVADRIYMHPGGSLDLHGLRSNAIYYADALAKLGVRADSLHIGRYKSANDGYARASRRPDDRRQRIALLDPILATWLDEVARDRKLDRAALGELIDQAQHPARAAQKAGLIDDVVHEDELAEAIGSAMGRRDTLEIRSLRGHAARDQTWVRDPYIGVLLVQGTITDGESFSVPLLGLRYAGRKTITHSLDALLADPACRAILVRVDSPGGSAIGSEKLWRAIELAKEQKPLAVSMGGVAASGGYYLAAPAERIFARPLTLTGSIGVTALRWDISGLAKLLGIRTDAIERGALADIESIWAPATPRMLERLRASVEASYRLFVERVATGRKLSEARTHALAQGRVFLAQTALRHGLVDDLSGLSGAWRWLEAAVGLPKWEQLDLRVVPDEPTLLELALRGLSTSMGMGKGVRSQTWVSRRAKTRARSQRESQSKTATVLDAASPPLVPMPALVRRALGEMPVELLYLPPEGNLTMMPERIVID